jgi:hypothetical protein
LCAKSHFSQCHLVNRIALSWVGCDKDFVGSLGLFAAQRKLGHCIKEVASALGWLDLGNFLGDFAIECKLLELGEAQVAEVVVPSNELGLFIGGGKLGVLSFLEVR